MNLGLKEKVIIVSGGAKGIGEPPCISVTPAIVAAIRDATGKDLLRIPVRPQDICL